MTTRRTLGTSLHPDDRAYVLRAYTHRSVRPGGPYPQQFRDTDGRLDHRARYCESHPTWPHNPELQRSPAE